jgi:putative resolvase
MDYPEYVSSKQARSVLKVSGQTLLRWEAAGYIETVRSQGGHRRYNLAKFLAEGSKNKTPIQEKGVCYARVSSVGQKVDLENQAKYLSQKYPEFEVIKDIGSGLNFKRKGFARLVELILKKEIKTVVVTHRDRLCRFGFELLEQICAAEGGKIVVLDDEKDSPEKEFTQDLLSIITVFSSRLYGLRSHKIKDEIRKAAENKEDKITSDSERETKSS